LLKKRTDRQIDLIKARVLKKIIENKIRVSILCTHFV
jgi:hypothetical protein